MRRFPSHARLVSLGVALSLGRAGTVNAQVDTSRRAPTGIPPAGVPSSGVRVSKARAGLSDTVIVPASTPTVALTPPLSAPPPSATPQSAMPIGPPPALPAAPAIPGPRTWSLLGTRGLVVGIGGGTAAPTGTLRDVGYEAGTHVDVSAGWRPRERRFGVRGLLAMDQVRAAESNPSRSSPKIFSLSVDGVLNVPLATSGDWYGLSLYALGGTGIYHVRGFGRSGGLADALGDGAGRGAATRLGVDAGGGVECDVGAAALFVEARWANVFARGVGERAGGRGVRWVPMLVGVTLR